MQFADRLTFDAPKRTSAGFMAVRARAARIGIYDYLAHEVNAPADKFQPGSIVRVLRDEDEVFAKDSVASFLGKPITDDHPREGVTRDNYRDHARGTVMNALRDGDFLAFDLMLMDGEAIDKVDGGKRELSNGYSAQLDWTPGTHPRFGAYDAIQRQQRGNHVAIVKDGRAGPHCAIKDGESFALCDANPSAVAELTDQERTSSMPGKTLQLDGIGTVIDVSDSAQAAIDKLQAQVNDGKAALDAANTKHSTELAAKDAEIDTLKAKVLDDAAIDAKVAERTKVLSDAKAIAGDKLGDVTGKSLADVRKAALAAVLPAEQLADKDEAYLSARFDIMAADAAGKGSPAPSNVVNLSPSIATGDNKAMAQLARASRYSGL